MAIVRVYKFKIYDINTDDYVVSRRMGLAEAIEALRATAIPGTEADIDDADLDPDVPGFTPVKYVPPISRWP